MPFGTSVADAQQPGRAPVKLDFPRLNADKEPLPLQELLYFLQNKCIQYGVTPHDFFVDYDRTCSGTITIPQFRAALFNAFGPSYIKAEDASQYTEVIEKSEQEGDYGMIRIPKFHSSHLEFIPAATRCKSSDHSIRS